jgi:RNA polymerase sigma-70 factor (ECF subfamily)
MADLTAADLPGHRLPAVRAELLGRAGDRDGARTAYDEAITTCDNEIERRHLTARRVALGD